VWGLDEPDRMLFRIRHVTRYAYEKPASHSYNKVQLAPIDAPDQKRLAFSLEVTPPAAIAEYRDTFGNLAHSIDIQPPHTELVISSASLVDRLALPAQPSPPIRSAIIWPTIRPG
jgi:transglutaminase-like putative cysteine protease